VRALNGGDALVRYPGSPWLAHHFLRRGDRLVVNELHPEDGLELRNLSARDRHTTVLALDGWIALKSLLPPPERRGVVLVDPPFEAPGELERLASGLRAGLARFATGIYLLWYPIKDVAEIDALYAALLPACPKPPLRVEIYVRAPRNSALLNGAGLAIVNPPYRLEAQLAAVLPEITRRLAAGPGAHHRLEHAGAAVRGPSAPPAKRRKRLEKPAQSKRGRR
jgi:23S rRNA (adenine2030-N6)-methyltransferase